jgi:hypothetical protein
VYNDNPWDPKKLLLLTGGRFSEVIFVLKVFYGTSINDGHYGQVVDIRGWLLAQV